MVQIILIWSTSKEIIAEKQAGFRAGTSTTGGIFNLRIWQGMVWSLMDNDENANIIWVIENLYGKT